MQHKCYRPVAHNRYSSPGFGRIGADRANDGAPKRWWYKFIFNHKDLKGDAKGAKGKASEMLLFCRCDGYKFLAFASIQANRRNNGSQERGEIG